MNQCAQKLLVVILTSIVFILYQGVECKVLNQNNNRPQWTTHQDKVIGGADYKEHKKVLEYFDEYYEDSLEDSAINTPHHYLGQEQHLDDDGDPRYITEDDVEESYNYDSEVDTFYYFFAKFLCSLNTVLCKYFERDLIYIIPVTCHMYIQREIVHSSSS